MYLFTFFFISVVFVNGGKISVEYEMIEKDIRLTPAQREKVYKKLSKLRGLGMISDDAFMELWRNHYVNGAFQIPVVFDEDDEFEGQNNMSPTMAASVLEKMRNMEDKLGNIVRFVTDFDKGDYLDGYLRIGSYTTGCWSYVGRLPTLYQPQVVNIGTGCDATDVVEHELMHALGFFHEHARPDRDNYVVVHWDNIPQDKHMNFEIAGGIDSRGSPYDRRSLMHYDNYAFAVNTALPTLTSTDPSQSTLGSATTMTTTDMEQIRMLYRCSDAPRDSYDTNCDASCPCRYLEGTCVDSSGCDGSLTCSQTTQKCDFPSPTATPTTRTPTHVGETFAPTTTPTTIPTRAPTTATPTATPTATTPTTATSHNVNIGLVIGMTTLGIAIIIGSLFF